MYDDLLHSKVQGVRGGNLMMLKTRRRPDEHEIVKSSI